MARRRKKVGIIDGGDELLTLKVDTVTTTRRKAATPR